MIVFAAVSAQATDIYRWTDAEGVVHYTDQVTPGAEKIRIETTSSYKGAATVPGSAAASKAKPAKSATSKYAAVEITSPTQEEVLWNIAGQVAVSVKIEPDLQPGHKVRLYLDNQPVDGLPDAGTQFQLQSVYRGVHTLRAEVLDDTGKTLTASSPVTFAVRQTSVVKPAS